MLVEVCGGGAAVEGDVVLQVGDLGDEGVAGGVLEDGLPMLFEGAEVAVDGGGGGVELLGDAADACAALAELVGAEDAAALSGGEGWWGTHVLIRCCGAGFVKFGGVGGGVCRRRTVGGWGGPRLLRGSCLRRNDGEGAGEVLGGGNGAWRSARARYPRRSAGMTVFSRAGMTEEGAGVAGLVLREGGGDGACGGALGVNGRGRRRVRRARCCSVALD